MVIEGTREQVSDENGGRGLAAQLSLSRGNVSGNRYVGALISSGAISEDVVIELRLAPGHSAITRSLVSGNRCIFLSGEDMQLSESVVTKTQVGRFLSV